MATTVNVHQAKTHLSDLLNKALRGEEVIIARANKPLVRLVPVEPDRKARTPGLNASPRFWMAEDFDAPLPEDFWDGDPDDALNTWIREQGGQAKARKARARRR
jgi:prevent-host-death family protein